jgi:hypothetical protein
LAALLSTLPARFLLLLAGLLLAGLLLPSAAPLSTLAALLATLAALLATLVLILRHDVLTPYLGDHSPEHNESSASRFR